MRSMRQLQAGILNNYRLIIIIICVIAIGILLRSLPGHFIIAKPLYLLELDLQDLRMEYRVRLYDLFRRDDGFQDPQDSPVALVLVSEKEFSKYGFPPDRGVISEIVRALAEHGAKVIAFDMTFELEREADKTVRLASESEEAGNVIYPVAIASLKSGSENDQEISDKIRQSFNPRFEGNSPEDEMTVSRIPQQPLFGSAKALGHVQIPFDLDGKVRRVPLIIKGQKGLLYPSLSLISAILLKGVPPGGITVEWGKHIILDNDSGWSCEIPINQEGLLRIDQSRRFREFPRKSLAYVYDLWKEEESLKAILTLDELQSQLPYLKELEDFKGKVVLIGYLEERSDQATTPLELRFPGVAIHATIVENIVQGQFVRESGFWLDNSALVLLTILMVVSLYSYRLPLHRPKIVQNRLILIAVGILLGYTLLNFLVFCAWGILVNLSLPLGAAFLSFLITMGYRYVTTTEEFIEQLRRSQTRRY
jgi:CHASE2 domain-containing sensor protein